jgi:tRNA threonylcarbamoyladenosine biosynthesis protein TsaE
MQTLSINNLTELKDFAERTAAGLRGGETIGLVGDLGAGKTTFTQALAAALGVTDAVRSPTFVLMNVHEITAVGAQHGIRRLCHVDAYRIEDESELFGIGLEEYLHDPHCVTVVEWADRAPSLHRVPGFREITFRLGEGEQRLVDI